jgi:hypothetical protein
VPAVDSLTTLLLVASAIQRLPSGPTAIPRGPLMPSEMNVAPPGLAGGMRPTPLACVYQSAPSGPTTMMSGDDDPASTGNSSTAPGFVPEIRPI